jgi:hypothetical protein
MVETEKEKIYLFGPWTKPDNKTELTKTGQKLGRFLSGKNVPLDRDLKVAIREEFRRQEKFRQDTRAALQQIVSSLTEKVEQMKISGSLPVSPARQFMHGYHSGLFTASCDARQLVIDVLTAANLELCK